MTTPYLLQDIQQDEGRRHEAYPDPLSHSDPWTIGVGHTGREVHPGLVWTDADIDRAFERDIFAISKGLDSALPWWRDLNDARQDVLLNMAFNMGVSGLIKFHSTLDAEQLHLYATAAADMMASLWARQVGARAHRLAEQMRTGVRA